MMNSKGSALDEYLKAKQRRRQQIAKRRKRMALGEPVSIPLKSISLNREQRGAISASQTTSDQEQGNRVLTSKRFALLVSLCFHLIGALIATLYIVQAPNVDDDAVVVNLMKWKPAKVKRRVPPRQIESITPPKSFRIQAPQLRQPTTAAVEIPSDNARFIPHGNLRIPVQAPSSAVSISEALDKKLRSSHRAEIPSEIPEIKPQSSSSVLSKIETHLPDPDFIELPDTELSDVTQRPRLINKVEPKYPESARRAQKEGVVMLEATIGVDGMARDIQVVESLGFGCDEAAAKALKASRFAPAKQGKTAVPMRIRIPYRFIFEN